MWYWGTVIIAVLAATHGMVYILGVVDGQRREQKIQEKIQKCLLYQETSQQTRQRGTPEQERGSDDTG